MVDSLSMWTSLKRGKKPSCINVFRMSPSDYKLSLNRGKRPPRGLKLFVSTKMSKNSLIYVFFLRKIYAQT